MQTPNPHISIFTDLLPQYRLINSLYKQVVDSLKLNFEDQCRITDFHNTFKNRQAFEKTIVNLLLSTDKEKLTAIVTNLKGEIGKNIELYIAHKELFDGIDTLKVCTERRKPLYIEIEGQLKDTNKLWQELTQIRGNLESANWSNDKIAIQRLTKEEEITENRYKNEQKKLDVLYQQQKESDNHASRYIENAFEDIYELGLSLISLLDNHFPVEKGSTPIETKPALKPGAYFDMKLVSLIHHECNNIQFENLSETDLYSILNLQSTNGKLIIKDGERTRMCYLIYKLYEYLKTENRTEWRAAILRTADIKEEYYKSKYKEPISEVPSRKNEDFSRRIDGIFDNLS